MNLIRANPSKYNKMLAETIDPKSQKVFAQVYFQALINKQHLKRAILHTLFDRNGSYYSQNTHILAKYNELFNNFKDNILQKLERINREI